jgi:hypothetical protein
VGRVQDDVERHLRETAEGTLPEIQKALPDVPDELLPVLTGLYNLVLANGQLCVRLAAEIDALLAQVSTPER